MDFVLGILFTIIGTIIEGAYGMVAWNMAIPVIFEGAPTISLLQSIIIAIVASIMTYGGSAYKDEIDTKSVAVNGLASILMILFVSTIMLALLWLIMKVLY